ncbi:MAG TPA: AIR synthase-related protein, partial [Candidatus Binatia bacterium]|nr:AIR synthase-related protein [Candidatus Binatia bacterium]
TIDDACVPPEIMLLCQKQGTVSDEEAYKTWNMGQGMVLITSDASAVMDVAKRHGIESKVIGTVTQEPGIRIVSKGAFATGKVLHF